MSSHRRPHSMSTQRTLAALAAVCLVGAGSGLARADEPLAKPGASAETDRFTLTARSTSYVRLFQRALLPGPNGAAVSNDLAIPFYEYVDLRATDIDAPWKKDSVDVELAAWGAFTPGEAGSAQRIDGDITVANVRQRFGPAYVRIGRQVFVGGAARYSQFDGVSLGARSSYGLGIDTYAGLTVLPRWADRPGYHHLGSAADSLLRTPDAYAAPSRSGYWLAGGRASYALPSVGEAGVAFHEEREDTELSRRNASADLRIAPSSSVALSAQGVLDLDSSRLADGRAWVDLYPTSTLSLTAEYLRTDPALFLSRQSVLGVFAANRFDEAGGELELRATPKLTVAALGYVEMFENEGLGTRTGAKLRYAPLAGDRLLLQLAYTRVLDAGNGYHSTRASARLRLTAPVVLVAEQYTYQYDQAVRGISTSTVEAANVEWHASPPVRVLCGASATRSPYAALDVQALLRVVVQLDGSQEGRRR